MKFNSFKNLLDVFYLFITQGLNYIIPLIIFPYLLRVLGPDKFGAISLAQATAQYFILIVDFGFNLSATRRIAIHKSDAQKCNQIFCATFAAKIILCIICYFIQMLLTRNVTLFIANKEIIDIFFLSVVGTVIFPMWYFQGVDKVKVITIVNLLTRVSIFPLILIFVKSSSDYKIAAYLQAIIYLLSGIFSLIYVFAKFNIELIKVSIQDIFGELKEGWLVFLSSAAINVYTASFVVILGVFATNTLVGYYTAAEKLIRVSAYLFFAPISQSFYPKISSLVATNKTDAIKMLKWVFKFSFVIFLIQGIVILFFGDFLVIIIGKEYTQSLYLIKIMSFVPMFIGLGGVVGQLGFLAFGETKQYAHIYFISGILSIIIVFLLTPIFKEVGTAFALLITEAIVLALMLFYGKKQLKYFETTNSHLR